jgi:hypothetical protein
VVIRCRALLVPRPLVKSGRYRRSSLRWSQEHPGPEVVAVDEVPRSQAKKLMFPLNALPRIPSNVTDAARVLLGRGWRNVFGGIGASHRVQTLFGQFDETDMADTHSTLVFPGRDLYDVGQ